jgi:hypothetical protein
LIKVGNQKHRLCKDAKVSEVRVACLKNTHSAHFDLEDGGENLQRCPYPHGTKDEEQNKQQQ